MKKVRVKKVKGEPFRYWVASSTRAEWHLVDLTARQGQGECACEFYWFQARMNYKRHGKFIPYGREGASECRHIAAARLLLHKNFVQPLLATQAQGTTPEFIALVRAATKKPQPTKHHE